MRQRSIHQILDEITDRIKQKNMTDLEEPIPLSDSIYRFMMSDLAESARTLKVYLDLLVQSHTLVAIKITENDPRLGLDGVDGFVVAEEAVIQQVREVSNKQLERIYEGQFHKSSSSSTIIHELFPKIATYKSTPLGQALNISVMLHQFLQIIAEIPEEYQYEWKQDRIRELLHEENISDGIDNLNTVSEEDDEAVPGLRATDSVHYQELEQMDLSGGWGQAYKNYGGKFLLRVHFRRNEFDLVKRLIKQKRIAKEEDLRFIRDTMRNMESRKEDSDEIRKYLVDIVDLRRQAQMRLNHIRMAKEGRI